MNAKFALVVYRNCYGEHKVYLFNTKEQAQKYMEKLYQAEYDRAVSSGEKLHKPDCICEDDNAFIQWKEFDYMDFQIVEALDPITESE